MNLMNLVSTYVIFTINYATLKWCLLYINSTMKLKHTESWILNNDFKKKITKSVYVLNKQKMSILLYKIFKVISKFNQIFWVSLN